ncbi:PilW family protein [Polycyclovorans algicola]|uniref:PilW family protein n=1 Tax=Polycyclovorans algicola TaxID=616992 RepID=UPI0004A74C99|nr:PilW family protein [Polycyclovorans algicola]
MTTARRQQHGLTLIELMIAGTLGLILLLALVQLFVDNNRHRRQNQQLAGLQDQGRYALAALTRDLQMAGYWGGLFQAQTLDVRASALDGLADGADCGPEDAEPGWAFDGAARVAFFNDASGTAIASHFGCLTDVRDDTDAVLIRRVSGQASVTPETCDEVTLMPQDYVVKTNGVVGSLLRVPASGEIDACAEGEPLNAPLQLHRYLPRLYYIRDWAVAAGDGIPTLCRKTLRRGAVPGWDDECVAEGVEDLQIVWGIDDDADFLNTPDRYTAQPSDADLLRAVTAQVSLRVRASEPDRSYSDMKTYTYPGREGGRAWTPRQADDEANGVAPRHYYRKRFATTVQLKNPLP